MAPMGQTGQLSALVDLIANATKIVEAHYRKSVKPYVSSLDDLESHPLDDELSDAELRNAIQTIEGACAQLSATVARPSHTIVNRLMGSYEPACLNVAITFKIADILQKKPQGMHVSEIGKISGLDERKLGRILRLLATKHIFREISRDVFANNRLSLQLLSSNPISSLGLHFTDECHKSSVLLSETLADPDWGFSYQPQHTPFNKYSKYPEPLFLYYEGTTPEGAKLGARFGLGMIGWGVATEASAVVHAFPWGELGHGASVCDLGGGIGHVTMQLAKAHPTLQLKLQDLPERILQAKNEVWPKECPEAIQENRIEFEPIDFLSESPIKDCNVYLLKNIIHDWPDEACVKILTGVRKAMAPYSRVLVQEYILQHASRLPDDQSEFIQAPQPLLPNYGVGRLRQYNLDIDMMTMLNSEERRLEDFIRLGDEAGLKFEKLWDIGDMGVVEYRLP